MIENLHTLRPEMAILLGACACLAFGLSSRQTIRRLCPWAAAAALAACGCLAWQDATTLRGDATLPDALPNYVKIAVAVVGTLLLMVLVGVPAALPDRDRKADPAKTSGGEMIALLLASLCGVMLCAGAGDLVWLFLALELTSLPTYVMVAAGRRSVEAQEAAVKYFFLGALAAATFLYGFALIYGATGFTQFDQIRATVAADPAGPSPMFVMGLLLAILGMCFKIAAFPMHFYAADVYEGAATAVTALLAFAPKTAGFMALFAVLGLVNWQLPAPIIWTLAIIAVATMTLGNVLGLLQSNIKRVLAYSSIAHSGYMLVGLIAGPATTGAGPGSGAAAILFYLVIYGLATLAAFGVLSCLERCGEPAQTYDDIAGLARREPVLAATMLVGVLSLLGFPLTAGFLGKIYLFGAAVSHGYVWLVVIAVLNSAISAVYYLRIVSACYFVPPPSDPAERVGGAAPRTATAIAALAAVALFIGGGPLITAARLSAPMRREVTAVATQDERPPPQALSVGSEPRDR